jgi:WD40 repeat protein
VSTLAAPPISPFKGLAAFEDSELDALFFFGRERERAVFVANLLAARLTVLYGESGVGKSSLLGAGVARELRSLAPDAVVALRDSWSGSVEDVLDEVRGVDEAYLILDQFEEYFLYHGEDDEPGALLHDLPELLRESRVNLLVSLREDSLARLDAFKARIPSVFGNQVRLEHLDRDAARSAILGPIARWNELTDDPVEIEPALVEAVLDEVTRDGDRIEAPYLQLVLERIWHSERDEGSRLLRLETLRRLGGAEAIVRDHLHGALAGLDADEQDVAANMFEHLVTPSGTKIAHRAPDLAEYANVPEDSLRRVLAALTRDRIVHSVDGSDRYEIFHDVLAEPIRGWRQQRRLERERAAARGRQRRLVALAALACVAFAVVAGLAIWALSERSAAQSQARHARARALEASALQQLFVDPNRSVSFALVAARLESGPAAETVLRQSLITDRLRLVRHAGGKVRGVAASPRGDLIAAAVAPSRVLLLDAHNRRLVRPIASVRRVRDVGFSGDGHRLVTASPLGVADVWDVRTGRRLTLHGRFEAARLPDGRLRLLPLRGRLERMIAHVRELKAAPGGRLLAAVAERGGHVQAWVFAPDGRLRYKLRPLGVKDVAFSPDGRLLATTSAEGFTHVWIAETGKSVKALHDAKEGANVVAFSPDGRFLASGGVDSGVRVWTIATWERTYFLFGHTNPVKTLAWSPDGRVIASASPDRKVLLWRLQGLVGAGSLAATLAGNDAPVTTLAFSADSARLVTGGEDGTVRVWDARPDKQLDLLGRAAGTAVAARWAGNTIVGAWSSGVVKTYNARTRRVEHVLRSGAGGFTSLGVSSDAAIVAAGRVEGTTQVWDSRSGRPLVQGSETEPVSAVAVSPRGALVASGDGDGNVRVWNPHTGKRLWTARQAGKVFDLAFAPGGDTLVSAGRGGAIVWSAATGRRLHRLPSPGVAVQAAFGPDGRLVATADSDDTGRLWFARTGHLYRVLRAHKKPLTDIEFSDDGRLLATSGEDSDVHIWDVHKGPGHVMDRTAFGTVRAIDFDHTGRWVAAAAPISVIIFSEQSGRQLFYLRGHKDPLTSVSFAPRKPTVLSSSRDGTLRTYTCEVCVDLNGLVHLAERRIARTR